MKAWIAGVGLFLIVGTGVAQITLPPTPTKGVGRPISGGSNSGVGVVIPKPQQTAPKVITYTAVSPNRVWTNKEGKGMEARLLAFSAPEKPGDGPVEIIREGKVRFLMKTSKKTLDYAIAQLSQPDQLFIKALAQAAGSTPPAATKAPQPIDPKKKP